MALKADVWLAKRKGKRGTTYSVRWIDPDTGKNRCRSCGTDRAAAQSFRADKRRDLRNGINGDIRSIGWAEFVAEDVQFLRDTKKSAAHVAATKATLESFADTCHPAGPIAVTPRMIEKFIAACGRRDNAATSVNHYLRNLKAALGRAKTRNYLKELPGIEKQPERKANPTVYEPGEVEAVLKACDTVVTTARPSQLKAAIMLGLYAGLRRKEIIDLCWEDVSLDHARAEIKDSKGADRVQPFIPCIVDALRALRAEESRIGGRVFQWADDGRPWLGDWLTHVFIRIRRVAGITGRNFHSTRKTFCTDLAAAGVNQKICQELAGHASSATTGKYYQAVNDQMKRDAVAKLATA